MCMQNVFQASELVGKVHEHGNSVQVGVKHAFEFTGFQCPVNVAADEAPGRGFILSCGLQYASFDDTDYPFWLRAAQVGKLING